MPELQLKVRPVRVRQPAPDRQTSQPRHTRHATETGRLAIRSLYRELALAPKPGLVSPVDAGSHRDMDMRTFMRSLFSLRSYFATITNCGSEQTRPKFAALQQLGIVAERRMLAATGGINTHRGAIFNLGLLCAAAGVLHGEGKTVTAEAACALVSSEWGNEILSSACQVAPSSHGLQVAQRYGSGGARQEAAAGFPTAREVGLPVYRATLSATGSDELAAIQTLFALIAHLDDTNLLWRGGLDGLHHAQAAAGGFLARGGVLSADWRAQAESIHADFVRRNLSPGGSADLLGVTLFLHTLSA